MAHRICELLWIKCVLSDLGIKNTMSMNLYCDNTISIEITQNLIEHDHTKHVEVNRHFIKEKLNQKIIQFSFIKFKE